MDVFGSDPEDSKAKGFNLERLYGFAFVGFYPGDDGSIDVSVDLRGEIYLREGADHETYFRKALDEIEDQEPSFERGTVEEIAESLEYGGSNYREDR